MCRQSCGFGFFVINAVVEHVVARCDNLVLLVGEEERAVTLDLGAVEYLRKDGAQLGKVVEELLLLVKLVLAAPVLVELVGHEEERRQFFKAVLLGNHSCHVDEAGRAVDAGLLQLDGGDDGIGLEHQWKQALKGETARSVDDEVEVLVAHGPDKVEGILLSAELGTRDYLIQWLELWPALSVLLMLLDDAALRVGIEYDETAMMFKNELVGKKHAEGSLAAAAFLVGDDENLVASLLRRLSDVKEWYVHKVGCW